MSRDIFRLRSSGECVDADRRRLVARGAAILALGLAPVLPSLPMAQDTAPAPAPFGFDALTDEMRTLAGETWREPAQLMTLHIVGVMIVHASNSGSAIRLERCLRRPPIPRFFQSIAVKNPLSRKNSGIRKPWIAATKSPIAGSRLRS